MSTTMTRPLDGTMLFTATTTAKSSGDICVMTEIIGIAKVDIAAAGTGAAFVSDVHTLTKRTNAAFTVGEKVYYVAASAFVVSVASSNIYAGVVYTAATATEATCSVALNF